MPALSEHVNVWATALQILADKGYQVWRDEHDDHTYWAEKDGWDFIADSPVSLLGLIAIHDHVQPEAFEDYWWRQATNSDVSPTPTGPARPYRSVITKPRG